jgi:hypothetical protein
MGHFSLQIWSVNGREGVQGSSLPELQFCAHGLELISGCNVTPIQGFDKLLMENIRLVEAAPNGATYELDITEEWTNINGMPGLGLHISRRSRLID